MWFTRCLSVLGTLMGGGVLSALIARFYPSDDPLNRLYGAVFLCILITAGLLVYNLTARCWQQMLWRSFAWWPLPLVLVMGGWV